MDSVVRQREVGRAKDLSAPPVYLVELIEFHQRDVTFPNL